MTAFRLLALREAVTELRGETLRGVDADDVVRVAKKLSPHLYDGSFESSLSRMSSFTAKQAKESADRKREEHELEVERVLLYFVNEESGATP